MARFSERNGFVAPREVIQTDSLDEETRTRIWNVVYLIALSEYSNPSPYSSNSGQFAKSLWVFWHRPVTELLSLREGQIVAEVMQSVMLDPWYEVMDLLEFLVTHSRESFVESINNTFERFMVGWRIVGDEIVPVTAEAEVAALEDALSATQKFAGAHNHLKTALSLLSDRSTPKYAKVMHEAISAVEAVARHYTGERTLGAALKKLESKGIPAHKALTAAWGQLYGYTSDENGIRHGSVVDAEVDEAMATYFLVTCSAFVGYLIKKAGA